MNLNTSLHPLSQLNDSSDSEEEQSYSDSELNSGKQPIQQVMRPLFIARLNFASNSDEESDFSSQSYSELFHGNQS